MIDRICGHIHNYFTAADDIHTGEYTIANGSISLPFLLNGQYYRIVGSALNDGVYKYPPTQTTALHDETFTGEIWAMKVPKAVQDLATEIAAWVTKYGDAVNSPYQSENVIGVYSYTKASAGGADNGASNGTPTWQSTFGTQLNQWRKII